MSEVFILWHVHDGDEKLIGVYASEPDAIATYKRLKDKPGFKDYPDLISGYDEGDNGFMLGPHEVGKDHWTEGFV
jgi:hypothetical protein